LRAIHIRSCESGVCVDAIAGVAALPSQDTLDLRGRAAPTVIAAVVIRVGGNTTPAAC